MSDPLYARSLLPHTMALQQIDRGVEHQTCAVCGKWRPEGRRLYCSKRCGEKAGIRRRQGLPLDFVRQTTAAELGVFVVAPHGTMRGCWRVAIHRFAGPCPLETCNVGRFYSKHEARAYCRTLRARVAAGATFEELKAEKHPRAVRTRRPPQKKRRA